MVGRSREHERGSHGEAGGLQPSQVLSLERHSRYGGYGQRETTSSGVSSNHPYSQGNWRQKRTASPRTRTKPWLQSAQGNHPLPRSAGATGPSLDTGPASSAHPHPAPERAASSCIPTCTLDCASSLTPNLMLSPRVPLGRGGHQLSGAEIPFLHQRL